MRAASRSGHWRARSRRGRAGRAGPHGHVSPLPAPLSLPRRCAIARRELLEAGFRVTAGVRDVEAAESSAQIAADYGLVSAEQRQRLKLVQFDLTKPETLAPAIGNAAKVRACRGRAASAGAAGVAVAQPAILQASPPGIVADHHQHHQHHQRWPPGATRLAPNQPRPPAAGHARRQDF